MRKKKPGLDRKSAKYDVAYSRELETAHVKWADPYAKGPIRAFFVSSVAEGRTVVELMQRLTLEPRVVSVDPHWDVNRWCMDRYADFDGRDPKDYSMAWSVLEPELAAKTRYDVMVVHSVLGWNHIPAKIRDLIYKRVKRGEGLVLVHPQLGEDARDKGLWEVSPIVSVPPTRLTMEGAGMDEGYPEPPREAISGKAWQKAADHFIVDGIPFEALPYGPLRHYAYRLAKGAKGLATSADGAPVVAVKEYGKGRVVGLGYHNYGLFPELAMRRGELNENFWEYLFSLLARSIVWAARKEPSVRLTGVEPSAKRLTPEKAAAGAVRLQLSNAGTPKQARVEVSFRNELGEVEGTARRSMKMARGKREMTVALPKAPTAGGRHFVDVMVSTGGKKQDWVSATYEVSRAARVTKVRLDADAVAAGKSLAGRARLAGKPRGLTLVSELRDMSGRVLSRQEKVVGSSREVRFRLACPDALTNRGWVNCRLMDGKRFVDEARSEVALTAPSRTWQDYEVIMPWLHDGVWPWTDLVEAQYRRGGITSASDTQWEFPLTVSMHPPGFGVYWYRRHPYLERKDNYRKTGDRKYLERVPCIHTDAFRKPVAKALRKGIPPILKYSPLAYFLADESAITCYEDAFDLCWSDATLAEFRKWLRKQYRELAALNEEWGTRYRSWEKVMPVTWEEAQKRGNPAPWVDHRLFMNRTLAEAFRYASSVAQKVDPKGLVTISGTQLPGSHNGCDWSQIDKIVEYLQPYSGGGQDEMHRSFNPNMILTGFTGYAISGPPLEYEIWHRFLHGHRGASIFWGYSMVDPDLTLNAQGRSLGKCFGELRGEGLCRSVTGLKRVHDKVAIHFSMASGHTWWITDGKLKYKGMEYGRKTSPAFNRFSENRVGWGQMLEDIGYQYNYLPYSDLEKGGLAKGGFRALVLPGSIALSEKEAKQIRAFVKGGGLLLADVMPGETDWHGKGLATPYLADLFASERYGRGRAVLLGRWLHEYEKKRLTDASEKLRTRVREALEKARVRPRVAVKGEDGGFPVSVERVSWSGGGVEVLALLKETCGRFSQSADLTNRYEIVEGMKPTEKVRVGLPKKGHWYDMRKHKYLGLRDRVSVTLKEADPYIYAMLPYEVRGLSLSVSGGRKPGEAVAYKVKLSAGSAKPVRHVVKIEVFGPDGQKAHLYSGNIDTRGGAGTGTFGTALNDAPGKWRLVATDVFSGATAEKTWTMR